WRRVFAPGVEIIMSTMPQSSDGREALAASAVTAASSRVSGQARVETKRDAIREFHVNVPESELAELRRRINATRLPDRETVSDAAQGVQLATTQALARYWATEYDWRTCEAITHCRSSSRRSMASTFISFTPVRSIRMRCRSSSRTVGQDRSSSS